MEKKITAWIARDKVYNHIYLYLFQPIKNPSGWWYINSDKCKMLNPTMFPQVKWEDEKPTKVELTIKIFK